jgi:hypothetical protein
METRSSELLVLTVFRQMLLDATKAKRIYSGNQIFEIYDQIAMKLLDKESPDYYEEILKQRKDKTKKTSTREE